MPFATLRQRILTCGCRKDTTHDGFAFLDRSTRSTRHHRVILFSALGTEAPRGAAPPYTVIDLGTFGTVQSAQALDVNDAGQVVGVAGGNRAFLWQNGTKTDLGTLGSGSSASALGLNEAGQVVGYSALTTPPTGAHAVLWSNGAIIDLTPDVPSNQTASATAINEAGQVVGNIYYSTAFLWQNGIRTSLGHWAAAAALRATSTTVVWSWARPTPTS